MSQLDNIEREVLSVINRTVQYNKNRPITLTINEQYFTDVTGARRYSGSLYGPNEPYTDFVLEKRNTKGINIALKPVVFNESVQRLEIVVPGLKYKFIRAAYNRIMKMNIDEGQEVPNIFGKIDRRHTEMLIVGTYSVGGPVNYMYTGLPPNLKYDYDVDSNTLILPGTLIDIKQYAKNVELYLNLLPLYSDQKFDPEAERGGMKLIYGKSPSRGDIGNKIVIVQQPTDNGIVLDIE